MKTFWLKNFYFCHPCQRHWWCTLSCEYFPEFSKKFNMTQGLGGNWLRKITLSRNSQGTVPLNDFHLSVYFCVNVLSLYLGATSWADFCHADSYTPGRTHPFTTPLFKEIILPVINTMHGALHVNKRENKIKFWMLRAPLLVYTSNALRGKQVKSLITAIRIKKNKVNEVINI